MSARHCIVNVKSFRKQIILLDCFNKTRNIDTTVNYSIFLLKDPKICCENCNAYIHFNAYNDHIKKCISDDECLARSAFCVNSTPGEIPEPATSTSSYATASSSHVHAAGHLSSTSTASAGSPPGEFFVENLVALTELSEEYCSKFLHGVHEGSLANATDDFLKRGQLGLLLSALSTGLKGPNVNMRFSSRDEAFRAAFVYFKGPAYCEESPISVQNGIAIDVGGPTRQFFEDVFKEILTGKCFKLFEGTVGKLAPINSSATVMSGVLEVIGRICAHSLIQNGPAFNSLSPPIYWFIATGSADVAMEHCSADDAVSAGVKFAIEKVC